MSVSQSDLHTVRLRGTTSGPFSLSWGQGTMWESINALGPDSCRLNIVGGFSVRSSVPVHEALARLEACLNRFDGFRLAFNKKDTAATFRSEVTVGVRTRPDPGSPNPGTGDRLNLYARPFGLREAPIRLELLHEDGTATQIGMALSHLVFDGAAYRLLERHLRDAVEGREPPAPGIQHETLMTYEQSASGARRSDAVIERWATTATRLPPGRGLLSTSSGTYSVTEIRSPALAIAAQALAVSNSASTAGVLTAALAMVVRRHIDPGLSAMLAVCNNRMHPSLKHFVGQTIGNGLIVLPDEQPGNGFASFVKAVNMRAFTAYAYARYDSVKWRTVLSDLSGRGLATDLAYYFNDVRAQRHAWLGLERRIDELRHGLLAHTSVSVIDQRDMADAVVFANLHDAGRICRISVVCDDSSVPPADAALLLKDLEGLLVEQALAL